MFMVYGFTHSKIKMNPQLKDIKQVLRKLQLLSFLKHFPHSFIHSFLPWRVPVVGRNTCIDTTADKLGSPLLVWAIGSSSFTEQTVHTLTSSGHRGVNDSPMYLIGQSSTRCHGGSRGQTRSVCAAWLLQVEVPGVLRVWQAFLKTTTWHLKLAYQKLKT